MNDFIHLLYSEKLNEYQEMLLSNQIKEYAGDDGVIQVGDEYIKVVPNPIDGSYIIMVMDKYGRVIDEIYYNEGEL
jgi:hypothetical protein